MTTSKQYLSLETWNRKAQFEYFKDFEEPYYGICTELDCTKLYYNCRASGASFFTGYLHACMRAVNEVESFKYRIENDGKVAVYDMIHASATILREDTSFGFTYIPYNPDIEVFSKSVENEKNRVASTHQLFPKISSAQNVIHFSAIPWVKFTGLSHAKKLPTIDSIPKISIGKITFHDQTWKMPVSVHVNHALMDGYHVGQFYALFESYMNESLIHPETDK